MLKDVLDYNLNVVFCGTAKGKASARVGFYYAGPGNKFYSILHQAGFTPIKLDPVDCYSINQYKIGLTDLVHTASGNDNQIKGESYDVKCFIGKMNTYKPKYIAFNGKKSASFALGYKGVTNLIEYGFQNFQIGDSKVFILPSTSGSARKYWNEKYWFDLSKLLNE